MEDLEKQISESFILNHKYFTQTNLLTNEAKDYKRVEELLQEFMSLNICKTGNQIIGGLCLENILKYSKILEKHLENPKKIHKKTKREKVTITLTKLHMLVANIKYCFVLDSDDFDCLPDEHERKLAIRAVTTRIEFEDKKKLKKEIDDFYIKYNLSKAIFARTSEYKPSIWRNLLTGWLLIYYSVINKKKAKREAALFDSDGNIESMKLLWNVTESKLISKFLPITFPSINFNKVIFIPSLSPHVLDSQISSSLNQNPENSDLTKPSETQNHNHSRIRIRILSSVPLPKFQQANQNSSIFKICLPNTSSDSKKYEKLIIHIHGGGFLGQTSFSHQIYTRKWANILNEPIFSVDYRLAPENPFPDGLDDIWQAYTWLVNHSYEHLGVNPKKIILVGDSAGGNILTCLTLKCIQAGFRIPDAIFIIYPGLSFKIEHISKGALLSLNDQILSHGIYYVIREAYLQGKYSIDDALVSPSHCPDELLENFPKTEMLITLNDPLYGDTMRFADRLIRHGKEVHITEYPEAMHGALSFANDQGIPMFSRIVDDCIRVLKDLLK
ncbi:hypothetical protein SteCoe_27618 [Stentor coeruleus]|uniref:Alpha/beta hydrolase fold-3 domain-containing protein n=1 Tax=Stentor coeruleus TaxID=5963 RepID=A0A1R2BA84_9CILI|nr:hypothetical protein SteCoe_27618 [Stentor coeruleus]